jgi:SAM-dependent methyltransferase
MIENIDQFIDAFTESLKLGIFVKMTLGNYKGADKHLQKLLIRLVETKKGLRLFFLYRYEMRDTAKNYDFDGGVSIIREILGTDFFSAHLFTTQNDYQLEIGKKGKSRLNKGKPTFRSKPVLTHDREKQRHIDQNAFYLKALGITTDHGEIRDKQQDKWRQINKFVEIIGNLLDKPPLDKLKNISIVDMGSGKGYLTFAIYDYIKNIRGLNVAVTGVDVKKELIALCNDIASASGFEDLHFVYGSIDAYSPDAVDILIALHACNTATDDAIFKGIQASADAIIVAPCCQHELRPQLKSPSFLKDILKHAVMLERVGETLTDGLRSLLLERSGYSTRMFEFVSTEHTPKNNMLIGLRQGPRPDVERFDAQIRQIKEFYGVKHHHLEQLLGSLTN